MRLKNGIICLLSIVFLTSVALVGCDEYKGPRVEKKKDAKEDTGGSDDSGDGGGKDGKDGKILADVPITVEWLKTIDISKLSLDKGKIDDETKKACDEKVDSYNLGKDLAIAWKEGAEPENVDESVLTNMTDDFRLVGARDGYCVYAGNSKFKDTEKPKAILLIQKEEKPKQLSGLHNMVLNPVEDGETVDSMIGFFIVTYEDKDKKTQTAMGHIWRQVAKEETGEIDANMDWLVAIDEKTKLVALDDVPKECVKWIADLKPDSENELDHQISMCEGGSPQLITETKLALVWPEGEGLIEADVTGEGSDANDKMLAYLNGAYAYIGKQNGHCLFVSGKNDDRRAIVAIDEARAAGQKKEIDLGNSSKERPDVWLHEAKDSFSAKDYAAKEIRQKYAMGYMRLPTGEDKDEDVIAAFYYIPVVSD